MLPSGVRASARAGMATQRIHAYDLSHGYNNMDTNIAIPISDISYNIDSNTNLPFLHEPMQLGDGLRSSDS